MNETEQHKYKERSAISQTATFSKGVSEHSSQFSSIDIEL